MDHFDSRFMCSRLQDSTLELLREDLIGRISSQFYELTNRELDAIPVSVLFHILSHHSVMIYREDDLFSYISSRMCSDPESLDLLQFVRFEYLSAECVSDFLWAIPDLIDRRLWESITQRLILGIAHEVDHAGIAIDSVIISDYPEIFDEFKDKKWELLWRGSRDGFDPYDFHSRCDGHANTLTLIEDIHQFVFGGFTPVEWESRVWNGKLWEQNNCPKADDSMKTFIFTLRNPHNVPARKFSLKPDWKQYAIYCDGEQGPVFGVEADITVRRPCDTEFVSLAGYFGNTYLNDTGLKGKDFLTGSANFRVNEIEVFELID